jgi:hypothetical protein
VKSQRAARRELARSIQARHGQPSDAVERLHEGEIRVGQTIDWARREDVRAVDLRAPGANLAIATPSAWTTGRDAVGLAVGALNESAVAVIGLSDSTRPAFLGDEFGQDIAVGDAGVWCVTGRSAGSERKDGDVTHGVDRLAGQGFSHEPSLLFLASKRHANDCELHTQRFATRRV